MNKIFCVLCVSFLSFTAFSCSDDDANKNNPYESYHEINLTNEEKKVVEGNNRLAMSMLFSEWDASSGNSVSIAPYSVLESLAVLANGDTDDAREEIIQAITGNDDHDISHVNSLLRKLNREMRLLDNGKAFDSRIYLTIPSGYTVNSHFLEMIDALNAVNVNNNTSVAGEDLCMMVSTELDINWSSKLDNCSVQKHDFYSAASSVAKNVDMMTFDCSDAEYAESGQIQSVRIPFGNGNFALTCITVDGYGEDQHLTYDKISSLPYETGNVNVTIPVIDCKYSQDLSEALKKVGLRSLFDGTDAFNAICGAPVRLANAVSDVAVSVNKNGVTGSGMTASTVRKAPGITHKATFNRTFLYLVEEMSTGIYILAGICN